MTVKKNYKKKVILNPFTGELEQVSLPRSPQLDTVTNTSGSAISALKVLYYTGVDEVNVGDATDLSKSYVAGIANNAAADNGQITLVTKGPMSDSSWTWTPGLPLFVDATGSLTQTAPVTGNRVQVGHAISATEIEVNIQEPICL